MENRKKDGTWPYVLAVLACGAVFFGGGFALLVIGWLYTAIITLFYLLPAAMIIVSCIGTWRQNRFVWQAPLVLAALCAAILSPIAFYDEGHVLGWLVWVVKISLIPAAICAAAQGLTLWVRPWAAASYGWIHYAIITVLYFAAGAWDTAVGCMAYEIRVQGWTFWLGMAVIAVLCAVAAVRLFKQEGHVRWTVALWPLLCSSAQLLVACEASHDLFLQSRALYGLELSAVVLLAGAMTAYLLRRKKA